MWKASAMSASECTANPTVNSMRKKRISMPSITLMRVVLDHAILKSAVCASALFTGRRARRIPATIRQTDRYGMLRRKRVLLSDAVELE